MRVEFEELCSSCGGTGIYVGMAERDGYGVQCYRCQGTGRYYFVHEYKEFKGRIDRDDVRKIVQYNPGIVLSGNLDFGGMCFEEWQSGKKFEQGTEMRKYACPAWWYQCVDYDKKPDWEECMSAFGGTFSQCKYFATKENCWKRFDKENK